MKYDIGIIGGGPAGYNAGERAAMNGLKTILFEKKEVGGVCLNEGCIPSKTLLYSAKLLDHARDSSKYGISVGNAPTFDLDKIIGRKNKIVKKLTMGVKMTLKSLGVTTVEGEAALADATNESFTVTCNGESYEMKYLLLCTGSETVIPPIKGLSDISFWTSREALDNKEIPKSLAIIGGGVIGMEFASFFNSIGIKVSVIEMLPEILGAMDNESSTMVRSEYTKKGIKFYLGAKVTEVNNHQVIIEKDGKIQAIEAEKILLSVGRKPTIDMNGFDKLHLELQGRGVKVNEHMQTSHPNVYAAGDITGFSMLAHTAFREGEVAINHIIGLNDKINYNAIPGVVYTNPEMAGVGKTEEELKATGSNYSVMKLPMAYSGRFIAENETGNGYCKLIVDASEKIIGCHLVGNPASELIVAAGIAIEKSFSVDDFKRIVFPHPTVGEIIHESLFV